MALEIAGLVLGAVSALAALRGALDTALLIDSYFDEEKSDCGYLALRYHVQKTRMDLWRQVYKIDDPSTCPLRHKPEVVQKLVVQILGQITQLFDDSKKLVKRHQISTQELPPAGAGGVSHSQDTIKALSKLRIKPMAKFRWTIKGKAEFEEKVLRISTLVDDLQGFTIDASELRSLERALPSMSLKSVANAEMLQTLHDSQAESNVCLATSAKVKLLRKKTTHPLDGSVTVITNDQLRFLKDSSTLGTLRLPSAGFRPVWIEWCIISEGAAAPEYIRRIKALGYLLEQAGNPALRLPVCYGIFDDLAHEAKFGARRIGYVFGAPHAGGHHPASASASTSASASAMTVPRPPPCPSYDGNFRDHPPRTLSDLIRDAKSFPVPLLGDRFALAVALATAFGNFHSAGWLHKGFHSGSIAFLAHAPTTTTRGEGEEGVTAAIRITDPFVTGFQYARPAGAHSLSRGPLEDGALEHYYHPAADKGFSRRLDLYSLGVVLCEVGRWGLVAATVSEGTRRRMVDRAAWRNYMVTRVLADIGWRMGAMYQSAVRTLLECRLPDDDGDNDDDDDDDDGDHGGFFEQEYFEKVIRPLSACSA
ncbi:putative HET-s domain [Rosellinia necatrix]|uniref:Putative HET-s domain n=1 Tax=Rosellinia necatrix TaxID=77044 RepID=A0A1W2THA3_ROSNE|nr:putative HET-s domain [Rosellinia necatrix]